VIFTLKPLLIELGENSKKIIKRPLENVEVKMKKNNFSVYEK
jgi:hypothetical protein